MRLYCIYNIFDVCADSTWSNKQKYGSSVTLELRRIPPDMNSIAKINEHFARFGTLVNLQVGLN